MLEQSKGHKMERRKNKLKFLFIDDNSDSLELYKIIAKQYDVFLETTTVASKFIELFNEGNYDVALVNYVMPINGVTLSRLLKKDKNPNTKLYFITSHDEQEVKKAINGDKYSGIFSKEIGFSNILSQCIGEFVHERV